MEYPAPEKDPYEGIGPPPPGMAYSQMPPDPKRFSDPEWYDSMGGSRLQQADIFNPNKSAEEQIALLKGILRDTPRDPDDHDRGYEILFQASFSGSAVLTKWLLKDRDVELGGPIDLSHGPPEWDDTIMPLHAAAFKGHLDVINCLIEEGCLPIDQRSHANETPLMRAAFGGHLDIARYLLEHGADPSVTNQDGKESLGKKGIRVLTPVDYGARSGNMELLMAILDALAVRAAKDITRENAYKELRDRVTGFTVIVAAQSGSEEMLSLMLNEGGYGQNLGPAVEDSRRRGIMNAIPWIPKTETATIATAHILLNAVLERDGEGKYLPSDDAYLGQCLSSGIVNAASRGYPDILRLFIRTLKDCCASTPDGQPDTIKKLLAEEAFMRTCTTHGLPCAALLIDEFGVDINATDPDYGDITILDVARRLRAEDCEKFFRSKGGLSKDEL